MHPAANPTCANVSHALGSLFLVLEAVINGRVHADRVEKIIRRHGGPTTLWSRSFHTSSILRATILGITMNRRRNA